MASSAILFFVFLYIITIVIIVLIIRWVFRINLIVDELTKIRKLLESKPTEKLSPQLQELKAKEAELEKKISFEVDQIRRLELKEELKKIKDSITQIERK